MKFFETRDKRVARIKRIPFRLMERNRDGETVCYFSPEYVLS